jgi:hypothetical protein
VEPIRFFTTEEVNRLSSAQGDQPGQPGGQRELWKYLGLGIQLALTVAAFAWLGKWLQERFGWPEWSHTAIALFGIAAGLYFFVKESQR